MLNKANISWNVKQVAKMISKGTISFDNAVQRGYEWDIKRQSMFIHSLITGYPIPPFYAQKSDNGIYDMLDGKQRMTTIARFLNNEFALKDVPTASYFAGENEMEVNINDCKYENLIDEFRDNLDSASLTIYYFDRITDDEVAEMFFRLNSGKPVSAITLTRVKALSKDRIRELGSHSIFNMALTKKALESYTNEDLVIKALFLLKGNTNLETKEIRKWISETEITDQDTNDLYGCFSRLEEIVKLIEKDNKKLAKKILTKTHFLSLIPILDQSRIDKVKDGILKDIITSFYNCEETSISAIYNEACKGGANKTVAVMAREDEIRKHYNKALDSVEVEE